MDRSQHARSAPADIATEAAIPPRHDPAPWPDASAAQPTTEPTTRPASEPMMEPSVTEPAPAEPCAEMRLLADERCELATRARAQAASAVEALRDRATNL